MQKRHPVRDGQLLTRQDIPAVVRQAREGTGLTAEDVARELGIAATHIEHAESQPSRALFKLRRRLLERFTGYTLDGPFYRVRRKR